MAFQVFHTLGMILACGSWSFSIGRDIDGPTTQLHFYFTPKSRADMISTPKEDLPYLASLRRMDLDKISVQSCASSRASFLNSKMEK
jgi:hypothetical protein